MTGPRRGAEPVGDTPLRRGLDWLGIALVTGAGALSALLECTLVPLYAGRIVVPIAVLIAVVLNVVLPYVARTIVPHGLAAAAPFAAWLIVIVVFGAVARPEGDVILPGGGVGGVEYVTYGMMFGGALAGAVTLAFVNTPRTRVTGPRVEREDLKRRRVSR